MMKPILENGLIRQEEAFKRMKKAHNIRQTVYVCGATGYGKTSFVVSYLQRRIYEYYTANEIEQIDISDRKMPPKGRIVVIDNLHELVTVEKREEAFSVIRDLAQHRDIWLILISRAEVPSWLMPLYIQHIFATIREDDLSLSRREVEQYFLDRNVQLLQETLDRIYEKTEGYPLAMRVVHLRSQELDFTLQGDDRKRAEQELLAKAQTDIWMYFESNVYTKWNMEVYHFLVQMSIVNDFDIEMAQQITKKNNAGELLRQSMEYGSFVRMRTDEMGKQIFSFRPQMVESMEMQLHALFSKTRVDALYRSAGNVYELRNQIPKALEYYQKSNDQEEISRLLIENAKRYIGVGHYWELRKYYLALPDDYIKSSPLMMSAMSMLQSILMNDEESERWYRELCDYAKSRTGVNKRLAKERILYLQFSLPHRGTKQVASLLKCVGAFRKTEAAFQPELSLTNNAPSLMNGGKDFSEWSKHDREMASGIGKAAGIILGKFGKGLVSLALAESLFETCRDEDTDYEVYRLASKGQMQAESGGKSELIFVAIGLLAQLDMFSGELDSAVELLKAFIRRVEDGMPALANGAKHMLIRFYLRKGNEYRDLIREWMDQAVDEDIEFCTLERDVYITKIKVYLAQGQNDKAIRLADKVLFYAKNRERYYLMIQTRILKAIALYRTRQPWVETLQKAFSMAEEYHFVRVFAREGAALLPLLNERKLHAEDTAFLYKVCSMTEAQAKYFPEYMSEFKEDLPLISEKALAILRLQAEGHSIEEIANIVGLSQAGVKYNNRETYRKLGVKGKMAAVKEARNRNLI